MYNRTYVDQYYTILTIKKFKTIRYLNRLSKINKQFPNFEK